MKINVAPWVENYMVEMEDLYTELSLEEMKYKSEGYKGNIVNYRELFLASYVTDDNKSVRREKILAKGDPGMGKTSLGKKIGWDWGKGYFGAFRIIFFVPLKLVRPGDLMEEVILRQMPSEVSNGLTRQEVRAILETHGRKCLLILDGYDEHDVFNEHVRKIVENQSLPNSTSCCHLDLIVSLKLRNTFTL